ncbi:very short patch repair protein [bacterium BMS3Bbin11]|nr:very short patch repair protein [bacterium BMS3Abin11]GBE44982.1 very short patch repair protein [bacterium BMS3Bbin11]GMT41173.1 MAG: hypothetical protein IEMM0001_1908 [bacterium]HDH09077.1 hypothetical protein [Gammaproteobacteria bacterium]
MCEMWGQITVNAYIRRNWYLTPIIRDYSIFTHGRYWHQHKGCRLAYSDRSYSDKWEKKFCDNQQRDQRVLEQLKKQGWRVAVICFLTRGCRASELVTTGNTRKV